MHISAINSDCKGMSLLQSSQRGYATVKTKEIHSVDPILEERDCNNSTMKYLGACPSL